VLYMGPRTWGQYFYEKLWLFPAEKEARRLEVRAAIERYVRPWLERKAEASLSANGNDKTPGTVNTSKIIAQTAPAGISNLELLERLHCRVYTKRIDAQAFYSNQPKAPTSLKLDDYCFTSHMRTAFRGITTVPKGLSIAQIAPFKVMADVRIMLPETRLLAEKYGAVGENGTPCKEVLHKMEGNSSTSLQLDKYYYELIKFYGDGEDKIVLEVQGIDAKHWRAAYSAAIQWIKEKKASVMLVPLYRPEDYEAYRNSIIDKKAWSSFMGAHLDAVRPKQDEKTGSDNKSTGNATTSRQLDDEERLDY